MHAPVLNPHNPLHYVFEYPWSAAWLALVVVAQIVVWMVHQ